MAINKRKVLDTARKFAQKGAKEKALKEYNKLVQADPRDAKVLLEIGDAYRRWGQAEEAIAQYQKVANQYKADGFDARAVAVLKQILNLDPKRYTAHVALAELYQRMGLDSDAVGALRTAADGYYRDGRRREALELLRRMAALDPSNTTSRMKVADLLRQEGMEDDAVAEYEGVIEELRRQGANEQICVVQERILEIRPDHVPTLAALARNMSDLGRPERAEPFAARAVEHAPEPEHFELLTGIHKSLGNDTKLADVTRRLAAYYRERGDEDRAREVLQRLPPESVLEGAGLGSDKSEFEEPALGDDELLDDEDFLVTDASDQSEVVPPHETVGADPGPGADVSEDDLPEGDPEQLVAEASVYLRYGKRTQAIASLRSALRQEPQHRGVLEKLGDAYAEEGREDEAIACWQQAIEVARADGDTEGFAVLRDRIGTLDPGAAAEIEPMEDASGPAAADADIEVPLDEPAIGNHDVTDVVDDGADVEFDMDIDVAAESGASGDSEDDGIFGAGPDESDPDLDLDGAMAGRDGAGAGASIDLGEDDGGIEIELDIGDAGGPVGGTAPDEEVEIDIDEAMDDFAEEGDAIAARAAGGGSAGGQSTTTAAQIRDDLEEAEFYLQQGLDDEAEGIYRRILEAAPNHPTALLKIGELEARRGGDPARPVPADADARDAGLDEHFDIAGDDDPGTDASLSEDLAAVLADAEASVDGPESAAPAPRGGARKAAAAVEATEEETEPELPALDLDEDGEDPFGDDATEVETLDAEATDREEASFAAEPVQAEPRPPRGQADDTLPITENANDGAARASASRATAGAAEASFDLAAELADVFEDEDDGDPNESSGRSTADDGFESLFASFKKGVSATLEEGDFDTRFDLGIAYREMGLFGDAISEFAVCLGSPARQLESLHMMALCAVELGRPGDAVSHLEQALSGRDLAPDRQAALQLDLGRARRLAGNGVAARAALDAVRALDPGFPGLAQELAALESGAGPAPETGGGAGDGFESFDDLWSDDASDVSEVELVEPAEAETFESFDDVITEVEADEATEPPAEPVVDPDPPTDPGTSRSGRKKKRISFV